MTKLYPCAESQGAFQHKTMNLEGISLASISDFAIGVSNPLCIFCRVQSTEPTPLSWISPLVGILKHRIPYLEYAKVHCFQWALTMIVKSGRGRNQPSTGQRTLPSKEEEEYRKKNSTINTTPPTSEASGLFFAQRNGL